MPNNCSALIQRKQNILHKSLRANSDGKIQTAVAETTAELQAANARKTPMYSSSTNNLTNGSRAQSASRRPSLFANNRVQPTPDYPYGAHLPSIRDAAGSVDRQTPHYYDGLHTSPRPKTPLTAASPKSPVRPPSASISSLFNTLSKRSTENFMNSNGEIDELILPSSRQSRRPSNENAKYGISTNQTTTKEIMVQPKHLVENGTDTRYSTSPHDTYQQQRGVTLSGRVRSAVIHVQPENPHITETINKDRTNPGQLYQRRTNNAIKAPTKQKIDKFRRRSEEATHAINGNALMNAANAGLSATTPVLATQASSHSKSSSPITVRRVTSDAEIQARLDMNRLSMSSNLGQTEHHQQQQHQQQPQQQQSSRHRLRSPYLYTTHQQLAPPATPQTPPVLLRRSQLYSNGTQHQRESNALNYRKLQQSSVKQSNNNSQGNLYLAFIASRHLSNLDGAHFEYDIDHAKLLRIFTWIKNVEKYRHELLSHDKLITEQNQRMLDKEDDLSLYSEIQFAVDDLPANTSGKPCEKIPIMEFDN